MLAGTLVGKLHSGRAVAARDRRHQALRLQRPGDRPQLGQHPHRQARHARKRPAGLRDRRRRRAIPAAVMCSYNRVNGDFACENKYLLTDVLQEGLEVPRLRALRLGRNPQHREGVARRPRQRGARQHSSTAHKYKAAVRRERSPMAELDDHVHRILRSMFAAGIVDYPRQRSVVDPFDRPRHRAQDRRRRASCCSRTRQPCCRSIPRRLHTIAVIGAHADVGMISGGGSAQVDPPGGNAICLRARARLTGRNTSGSRPRRSRQSRRGRRRPR